MTRAGAGGGSGARNGRLNSSRSGLTHPGAGGRTAESERPVKRYERFEPVTVRAAARLLRAGRTGLLTAAEADFYLAELVALDTFAGHGARPGLRRLAQRTARGGNRALRSRLTTSEADPVARVRRPVCLVH